MLNINYLTGASLNVPAIVLPLGISFFTFTQTAYLIDAYRGETKRYSLLTYSLFVTIFPHLIAGPIINHKDMIPQFSRLRNFVVSWKNLSLGLTLFSIGLFKKVAIADKLGAWVSEAFAHPESFTFLTAWTGALGYTFQLYFDFSAYSEMAIGLGLMFNLRFPMNFDSPYQSRSIIDFWRRWHMTLGAWVKSYLYIPLGGNREGELKKMRNLFVAMLLIGLWHGAGWTFVVWGGLHGAALVVNHGWRKHGRELPKLFAWVLTFLTVVVCWVFFRAESFSVALSCLTSMSGWHLTLPAGGAWEHYFSFLKALGVEFAPVVGYHGLKRLGVLAALMLILYFVPHPVRLMEKYFHPHVLWLIGALVLLFYSLLHLTNYSEFLYFQF